MSFMVPMKPKPDTNLTFSTYTASLPAMTTHWWLHAVWIYTTQDQSVCTRHQNYHSRHAQNNYAQTLFCLLKNYVSAEKTKSLSYRTCIIYITLQKQSIQVLLKNLLKKLKLQNWPWVLSLVRLRIKSWELSLLCCWLKTHLPASPYSYAKKKYSPHILVVFIFALSPWIWMTEW